MLRRDFLVSLAAGLGACASVPRAAASARVGRYTSTPWSFSTASYWIEGDGGVVLIDTQFLASEARALIEAAERATGKPVVTAIVLHPNPDKFNGTATLQAHGVEVLTSAAVLAEIPAVFAQRLAAFGDRYAPDFPVETPQPTAFGNATTTLQRVGLTLTLHVMGPGCGAAHVVVQWKDHVFVGDLVAAQTHAWMELAQIDPWLTRLDEIAALRPSAVQPGRGRSGDAGLLTMQRRYLEDVSARFDRAVQQGTDPDAVVEQIAAAYPDHRFRVFLDVAKPALWERALSRQRS